MNRGLHYRFDIFLWSRYMIGLARIGTKPSFFELRHLFENKATYQLNNFLLFDGNINQLVEYKKHGTFFKRLFTYLKEDLKLP